MKRNRLAGGNLRLRILLVFMLLLSATHVSATEKVLLENWSLLEQEDKAVGLSFDRYLQTEEGFLYTSNIVLRMGILGGPAQELKIYAELLVDGDYLARSYRLISELGGKQSEVLGVITGNQVTITVTDHDGAEYSSFFSEEGNGLLYFKDSFLDGVVRAKGLKVGERHTARVWDYGSNRFADFTFRVEEKTTYDYGGDYVEVFSITEEEPGQNTWLVSESGDLYRSYDPVEKLGARKVEKEDIPELSAYSLDVLLVPGNVRVAHPFRSVRSVIRVTWEDVDFADFDWTDNRQRLISHTETERAHEALVEIQRDVRDFAGRATLPLTDSEFAPYLVETRFITPSLPELGDLTEAICGEETDGWLVTQKILDWVYQNIRTEMIPQTLTTEEILTGRKGKCAEYAILFAAMARAAGLPTKVALGERYQDGVWVGHMWNEVWLGEWVAVDPSHGQSAPDALLLKFVDSPDVMGTQKVRMGLTGKLGITIEEVTIDEGDGAAAALQTGIRGQIYTNADYLCRMTVPDGYQLIETEEQGMAMLLALKATDPETQVVLLPFSVPEGTAASQILAARIPALQQVLPGFAFLGQRSGEIAGHPAAIGVWTYGHDKRYRQENWIIICGDCGYLFVFNSCIELWDGNEGDFATILEGFELIED